MADESFPLPGSSYKQLEKIITSYAELTEEATPAEVAQLAGTDQTNVSRNNKFLVAIGIIGGTRKKQVTELGKELARAITFDRTDEQNEVWSKIIEGSEFLQKIVSAVRIRRGMDSPTLVNHIAFSAGGAKNAATMAGAGAVLDILVKGKALVDQGGLLTAADKSSKPALDISSASSKTEDTVTRSNTVIRSSPLTNLFSTPINWIPARPSLETTLSINVQISCTPDEIDGLGIKLKKLIAELAGESEKESEIRPEDRGDANRVEGD